MCNDAWIQVGGGIIIIKVKTECFIGPWNGIQKSFKKHELLVCVGRYGVSGGGGNVLAGMGDGCSWSHLSLHIGGLFGGLLPSSSGGIFTGGGHWHLRTGWSQFGMIYIDPLVSKSPVMLKWKDRSWLFSWCVHIPLHWLCFGIVTLKICWIPCRDII